MKAFIKKLSVLFAMGALVFGSGLHHEETKVARAAEKTITITVDGVPYELDIDDTFGLEFTIIRNL